MRQQTSIRRAVDSLAPVQPGQGSLTIFARLYRDTLLFILKNLTYASHQQNHNHRHTTPMLNAECGTTWVHTAVGVYAPVRLHIVPPPSSLVYFIRLVAQWDMELDRKSTGGQRRRCVVNIRCSWPIPLTFSFVLKVSHWLSSHIHQSLTMNGLEFAVDDTTALPVLRRGFKSHCKDSELSSASNARSGHTPRARPYGRDRYDDRQRSPDVELLRYWFSLTAEKLRTQAPR
jgi:hypothetical protein